MAKISVELRSGTARFAVAVQATTIQQALNIAATRYPGNVVRVNSPIDLELFFVDDPAARARIAGFKGRSLKAVGREFLRRRDMVFIPT
jgi:hypothetical protein